MQAHYTKHLKIRSSVPIIYDKSSLHANPLIQLSYLQGRSQAGPRLTQMLVVPCQ